MMRNRVRSLTAAALCTLVAGLGACGGGHDSRTTTSNGDVGSVPAGTVPATGTSAAAQPAQHHSKLGGAVVGAAVGHVLGGHAVAGAAAGALVQHERNKHQ